jgi:hypothetical protein
VAVIHMSLLGGASMVTGEPVRSPPFRSGPGVSRCPEVGEGLGGEARWNPEEADPAAVRISGHRTRTAGPVKSFPQSATQAGKALCRLGIWPGGQGAR